MNVSREGNCTFPLPVRPTKGEDELVLGENVIGLTDSHAFSRVDGECEVMEDLGTGGRIARAQVFYLERAA